MLSSSRSATASFPIRGILSRPKRASKQKGRSTLTKISRIGDLFRGRKAAPRPDTSGAAFDTYESRPPSPQNAIDAIDGWNSVFPSEYGLVAGNAVPFGDDRIVWAMERFGDLRDKNVLELGPLEGAHTFLFDRAGAAVTAVEANRRAFLKCLITKEIVGLPRSRFLLGDFLPWLEQNETRWDFIAACGVLYHMRDPLRLLEAIAARTDAFYLWTHYVEESGPGSAVGSNHAYDAVRESRPFHGETLTVYRHPYLGAERNAEFCGGVYDDPRWMARESILKALEILGFTSLEIAHDMREHANGPCFSILARR